MNSCEMRKEAWNNDIPGYSRVQDATRNSTVGFGIRPDPVIQTCW